MAQTQTRCGTISQGEGQLFRFTEAGTANTNLTSSMAAQGCPFRLISVEIHYSAAPTQAGTTVTLNSGAGSAYDTVLDTGTANAQSTLYIPTHDCLFGADDGIDVTALAGGVGITAAVSIYIEKL